LYASPTVFNGVAYIGAEDGEFYAVNEATQRSLWSRFLGLDKKLTCRTLGITSTATVANDPNTGNPTVYIFGPDGNLYALDARTGAIEWKSVVDTPSTTVNDYYSWSSPTVFNGVVYVGVASLCDNPLVPAGVAAFDQGTGALLARWTDEPSTRVGASVWSSVAGLPTGSVIATTGNGSKGILNRTQFEEAVVRLAGRTLTVEDSWQVPAAQAVGDGDFGGSATDFTALLNGVSTPMFGACNKNGIYYAFRQSDLHRGPVWEYRMGAPTQRGVPGLCNAAAIWDGSQLIEGGGSNTTINGVDYPGSIQSLDPATGTPIWQTGLPGEVIGSPTENGAGLIAAQFFGGTMGVVALDASTGSVLGQISTTAPVFAQPVFDHNDLLVAAGNTLTAYERTNDGSR
jgi:outer membrane protein assembly factor BamB